MCQQTQFPWGVAIRYFTFLINFSGSVRVAHLAMQPSTRRALLIFQKMPRQLLDDLLKLLRSPDFKLEDLPKSASEFQAVQQHLLRIPEIETVRFVVCFRLMVLFPGFYVSGPGRQAPADSCHAVL